MIFSASTGLGSSQHSSRIIEPVVRWLIPNVTKETLDLIHYCVRKAAHFSEYAVLAILIWRALRSDVRLIGSRGWGSQFRLVLLLAALYAASDEFHQMFNSMREARVMDVVIDSLGATFGGLLWLCWYRWFRRK